MALACLTGVFAYPTLACCRAERLDPTHKEGSGEKYLEEKIEHGRAKSEDGVWKALLVRGEDRHRNWGHNHPPFPFSKGVFKRSLPKPDL